MTQIIDLGKLRFNYRGDYDATAEYELNDCVKYSGSVYIYTSAASAVNALPTDTTRWQRMLEGAGTATASQNVIYVAPHGTDAAGYGSALSSPYKSIRYACDNAQPYTTIFVKTGTYSEQLPITVPANVAIVGDNQRTVIVQPKAGASDDPAIPNAQATMWMLSNGSILNKMTFTGMTGWAQSQTTPDDITASTVRGVVACLNPASPVTTKSPYILECSAIGTGLIGAFVDGTVHASGAKSMLFHGYTVISDNGVGYWVKDGARAELVSCFTYYCYFGYTTSGGGAIRALNGNNSYGTWGAVSRGFNASETPVTGNIIGQQLNFTYTGGNINAGDTVTAASGGTATVTNVQTAAGKVYVKNATGNFTVGSALTFTSGGTGTVAAGALENQKGFVLVLTNLTSVPKPGASISIAGDPISYVVQSTTGNYVNTSSEIVVVLAGEKATGSAHDAGVTIRYKFSQIRLTGHDFLSIGTGGMITTNYPFEPTQPPAQGNEIGEQFPGRVFYVSTDQDGNFRVGEYFKIDQATGKATLNASAFDLSGLSSLRLGSIGAQLGEQINEFSSDATMSGNSNLAVPTEYAVKSYVDSRFDIIIGPSTLTGNTSAPPPSTQYRALFRGGTGRIDWAVIGAPPCSIDSNGVLTFLQALSAGTYNFTVRAVSGSLTVNQSVSLTIAADMPVFSTASLPTYVAPAASFSSTVTQATAASGTTTHTVVSGSLPTWATLSASGVLSGTTPAQGTAMNTFVFTVRATNGTRIVEKTFVWSHYYFLIQGQTAYTTPGTYSWVAPANVTKVSAVAVGGGAGGCYNWANPGGGGGGLGWKNNITVVPSQSYTVVVGAGGATGTDQYSSSMFGGNSYFIDIGTVAGYGGGRGGSGTNYDGNVSANNAIYGGGFVGDGGGAGGNQSNRCGGGAGGYAGYGGRGQTSSGAQANSGAANGGDGYSSSYGYGAGGGVGILGLGTTGYRFYHPSNGYYTGTGNGGGGEGGSGGSRGYYGENPWTNINEAGYTSGGIKGGDYGGGGGGSGTSYGGGPGGKGAVRIIWGEGRAFPSTNTGDVTPGGF